MLIIMMVMMIMLIKLIMLMTMCYLQPGQILRGALPCLSQTGEGFLLTFDVWVGLTGAGRQAGDFQSGCSKIVLGDQKDVLCKILETKKGALCKILGQISSRGLLCLYSANLIL